MAFAESVADADVARVMRDYVDQGFNVIVAHSFSYQDAVFEVAAEAPETNFAWAGGIGQTAQNVSDYDQPFYEPAYLVGILAGHVSKSGHLGALYGFDIPVCHAMGEAMLAGARTVNPEATLTVTAVGDWGDVAAAKEAGLAQVDTAGVDYWIGCGEGPTLGSIEAAKEKGGHATGYVGDMSRAGAGDRARQHRLEHGADLRPSDRADGGRQLRGRADPLRRQGGRARHRAEPEAWRPRCRTRPPRPSTRHGPRSRPARSQVPFVAQ